MQNNQVFLYTVKPKRMIVGLSGTNRAIRTNKSLYLTKEDVFLCLKNAIVYRRFANEGIVERVTIDDVERVHREKYISADDWKKYSKTNQTAADSINCSAQATVLSLDESKNKRIYSEEVIQKAINNQEKDVEDIIVESDDDLEIEKEEVEE